MFERFFPAQRGGGQPGRAAGPFEAMQAMMREPFGGLPWAQGEAFPSVDVKESDAEVTVCAELPGIDPKDVELTLENGVLTIRGQKREEKEDKEGENVISREIRYGSFSRSMALPGEVNAEEARASFDKGVLKITVPKAPGSRPTRVPIAG